LRNHFLGIKVAWHDVFQSRDPFFEIPISDVAAEARQRRNNPFIKEKAMISLWKTAVVAAFVSALWIGPSRLSAAEHGKPAKTEPVAQQAYLGVGIEAVDPALVKHLPETFRQGQGLLVVSVAAGSPAEKAGIKPHDILMSYGDQKLFAPQQLLGLVHGDKAGHEVPLTILRDGKPKQIKLLLGSRNPGRPAASGEGVHHSILPGNMPTHVGRALWWGMPWWTSAEAKSGGKEASKETFDSMTLQNLGNDRFKVQIQYLDKEGKLAKHKFEGTREEIHQAILAEKDLPAADREQLLRSLDLPDEGFDFPQILWKLVP
jgi:hypothetical protein